MGHRASESIIRTGDNGQTTLGAGLLTEKSSPPIEVLGAIDELNSWIGVVIALSCSQEVKDALTPVQCDLVELSSQISRPRSALLSEAHLRRIEECLERINPDPGVLKEFPIPGGVLAASFGHVARSVCRRAERQLVGLIDLYGTLNALTRDADTLPSRNFALCYLNRLSDLLLLVAHLENQSEGAMIAKRLT